MTYTVLSGTLNSSIPYHTMPHQASVSMTHNIVDLCPLTEQKFCEVDDDGSPVAEEHTNYST